MECAFQTPQTFRLFRDGLDVCLKDNWLRGCRPDHLAAPAQVSWTLVGASGIAEIVPQQEGFAPQLGRLQIPQGIFSRPTEVADGFIVDGGDIHRGEVPWRISRASCRASRQSVLPRSPGFLGIKEGATTQQV